MAKIMEVEILDPGILDGRIEGPGQARPGLAVCVAEDMLPYPFQSLQDCPDRSIHRDDALPILAIEDGNDILVEVHLWPPEGVNFSPSHPGVCGHRDDGLQIVGAVGSKPRELFRHQISQAGLLTFQKFDFL